MFERHFTVTTPGTNTIEYRDSLQNIIDNIPSETNTCYTDGSRTYSGSGAGYIITTDNNNTTLYYRKDHSSFLILALLTEPTAIIEARKYLSTYTNTHIIIHNMVWQSFLYTSYLLALNEE